MVKRKGDDEGRSSNEKKGARVNKPGARRAWFLAAGGLDKGERRNDVYARALEYKRRVERNLRTERPPLPPAAPGAPGAVNWVPIGPSLVAGDLPPGTSVTGRITALAVGPDGRRVYAGAANGGAWFSDNGGESWRPLDDYFNSPAFAGYVPRDSLAVGAIAVQFGNDETGAADTIYVGTGEPIIGGGGGGYFSTGIRVSRSGGAPGSWTLEAPNLAGTGGVFRIAIDPDDPTIVYAATTAGLYKRPPAGGGDWTLITSPSFASEQPTVTDLIVAGRGASKAYYAAIHGDRIYRSADGTSNWTPVPGFSYSSLPPTIPPNPGPGGRIALATGESNSSVYALADSGGTHGLLYRLEDGELKPVANSQIDLFLNNQGFYDIVLAVDPVQVTIPDPFAPGTIVTCDRVHVGGSFTRPFDAPNEFHLALFRCVVLGGPGSYPSRFYFNPDTSTDPSWIGRNIHPDIHAIAFATNIDGSQDGSQVWLGTDGGIFRSTTGGRAMSYAHRNHGFAITQTTYIAQRPDTDAVLFAGSQDQGTVRYWGEQAWFEKPTGDGGGVAIDPNDPYRIMRQYTHAELWTATDGGLGEASWQRIPFPPQVAANSFERDFSTRFYSPIAVTPAGALPTLAAFGTASVWLTADWGTTWFTLPSGLNPYAPGSPAPTDSIGVVQVLAFASGTRLYASTGTEIYRFDHVGLDWRTGWTRTTLPIAGLPLAVRAIVVESTDPERIYVLQGGGGDYVSYDHVWHFDGAIGNWHAAGFTQPDIPIRAAVLDPADPRILYVGTDIGCWKGIRTDGAAGPTWNWAPFSQGLPECAITDLAIHARARLLRAATYGRGVWEIPLDATTAPDPDIYLRVNQADTGRLAAPGGTRFPWVEGADDPAAKGYRVYHWMSADIKVRRGSLAGLPALGSVPDYFDFAFNIGDYLDSGRTETADAAGSVNRLFVQVHNRGLTPVPKDQVRVLLLLTDASAGLPSLPADYATHINAGNGSGAWLEGSRWYFADSAMPYRSLPADLDVRTPQIVEYKVDFATAGLPLPESHVHICAAAFITTTTNVDRLDAVVPSLDQLTMQDKHVAHRNLHLVLVPPPPSPKPSRSGSSGKPVAGAPPRAMLLQLHNTDRKARAVDLVVQRSAFPGFITLMPPKSHRAKQKTKPAKGLTAVRRDALALPLRRYLDRWFRTADRLARAKKMEAKEKVARHTTALSKWRLDGVLKLDRDRVYVASDASSSPTVRGIEIPALGSVTVALVVQAPVDGRPGDRFRFEVIQKRGVKIIGGSSYVVAVTRRPRARPAKRRKPRSGPSVN